MRARKVEVVALVACLAAWAWPVGEAWPCGAPIGAQGSGGVTMAEQTALIHVREEGIDVHARMTVEAGEDTTGFAWIFPVPPGASLSLGDGAVFEGLARATTPVVEIRDAPGASAGPCSGDTAAPDGVGAGGPRGGGGNVNVIEQGRLGDYEYSVLQGSQPQDVAGWLEDNGYVVPEGLAAAIGPYLEEGMQIAAARIAQDAAIDPRAELEPLIISMSRPDGPLRVGYPLALSRLGAAPGSQQRVLLYVAADDRMAVDGASYRTMPLQEVADHMAQSVSFSWQADYQEAIDELGEAGDEGLLVIEAALPAGTVEALAALPEGGGDFVTRFYGQIPVDQLQDVTFAPADQLGGAVIEPFATAQIPGDGSGAESSCASGHPAGGGQGWWAVWALGLVALLWRRRR